MASLLKCLSGDKVKEATTKREITRKLAEAVSQNRDLLRKLKAKL